MSFEHKKLYNISSVIANSNRKTTLESSFISVLKALKMPNVLQAHSAISLLSK